MKMKLIGSFELIVYCCESVWIMLLVFCLKKHKIHHTFLHCKCTKSREQNRCHRANYVRFIWIFIIHKNGNTVSCNMFLERKSFFWYGFWSLNQTRNLHKKSKANRRMKYFTEIWRKSARWFQTSKFRHNFMLFIQKMKEMTLLTE